MRRHNNKGAIELSANFIVVIVISIIIVVGGLAMFFKMKGNAQDIVSALDSQTEDRIKTMMLNSNDRTAVYPVDFTIDPNDAKLVGIGITNIYDGSNGPAQFSVDITNVMVHTKTNPDGSAATLPLNEYYDMTPGNINIAAHSQRVKGLLIKIPKGSVKGQYVYTINVTVDDTGSGQFKEYGILQVFANVK